MSNLPEYIDGLPNISGRRTGSQRRFSRSPKNSGIFL